ncbi:MAG: hypothetical protein FRX49_02263 [Trebouxia sp. A1-2]|nr:MAG: hypothetical protein FRX49_02263 [Trebouxia sp. A1-2]
MDTAPLARSDCPRVAPGRTDLAGDSAWSTTSAAASPSPDVPCSNKRWLSLDAPATGDAAAAVRHRLIGVMRAAFALQMWLQTTDQMAPQP